MTIVFAKHDPYTNGHLGKVLADMEHARAPTVRVMNFEGKLCALEGSHRLAAAYDLGVVPKIVVEIEDDDMISASHWQDVAMTLPSYEFNHVLVLDLNKAFCNDV